MSNFGHFFCTTKSCGGQIKEVGFCSPTQCKLVVGSRFQIRSVLYNFFCNESSIWFSLSGSAIKTQLMDESTLQLSNLHNHISHITHIQCFKPSQDLYLYEIVSTQICYKFKLCNTVWKFQDFSIIQILCEINFGESRSSKTAIFGALNPY